MPNIYALLVGINGYRPEIGKLQGCVNDVDHFHDYLTSTYGNDRLHTEILKDADATRDNIVGLFRSHLCRAGEGDVALFQYCGHGARWASAEAFHNFYPDGKDEGIVCYDSRRDGVYDLADKELAVLLAEVAAKDPHLAVIMDCCHSGSATRSVDDFTHLKARQTHEVLDERPLESYLDGFYEKLLLDDQPLYIPTSRHVLMAACERVEKAWESKNHSGVFTDTLMDVLEKSGSGISYADLFVRCRSAVRKYADNQNPQFETYTGFNAHSGFLGEQVVHSAPRYSVYFKDGGWKIDCGALHGLPTGTENKVSLALYAESDQAQLAGHATTTVVGPQKSDLVLDFEDAAEARYRAEIISLPVAPIPVYAGGDIAGVAAVNAALDPSIGAVLCDEAEAARYSIVAKNDHLVLNNSECDLMIQGVQGSDEAAASEILSALKHVLRWERSLALQNESTRLDQSLVDFWYTELPEDGEPHAYNGNEITLDFVDANIRGHLSFRNRTEQTLHVALLYFSSAYGIHVVKNDPISPTGDQAVVLWGDNPDTDYLYLTDGVDESIENFKLFVTTEKVDDFLLTQDELALGEVRASLRAIGNVKPRKKLVHENEWFTRAIRIRVARQCDRVGDQEAKLANGRITIKPHPSLSANLSLGSAKNGSRSAGGEVDIYKVLERIPEIDGPANAFELFNLSATRGEDQSVLELTAIQNADSLQNTPLEVELDIPLGDDEYILPLTFDGQHILLGADASKDDAGRTQLKIHNVPAAPNNRRSLGGSLKLYFFKTYLKRARVNQLRWVEYRDDGSTTHHTDGVGEKVAAAQNIVLLVHGIIGDTGGMAKGLALTNDATGQSVRDQFDLVLSYDYENLSTPIEETALDLRQQLEVNGLTAGDDKRLTLLVHSMGGLVSRWFVEKLGGNQLVDHLVMCGTPNNGSPYGKVSSARKLLGALATVALNTVPVAAPFCAGALFVLNRSKKVTGCLEQMNPESEFMLQLNAGDVDPGIPYTILAGSVAEFEDESGLVFSELLEKVGKGALLESLFGTDSHDIAVSRDSIRGIAESRNPAPTKVNVACHHLNHFVSDSGLKALAAVNW